MKTKITSFMISVAILLSFSGNAQINRKNTKKSVVYKANYQRMASGSSSNSVFEIIEGGLWAWGYNGYGQLGDGTTTNRTTAVQIGVATDWVGLSSGNTHSLGIKADGTLWGWGSNVAGQVGDGTTTTRTSPTQVGTDNKWISILAGAQHSIGLKSDGTLWAWGGNSFGQLGDGTVIYKTSPVQIGADNKWVSIAIGSNHSLGLKSDGTLWAWGANTVGQLGDGTLTARTSPVQISGADWVSISAGGTHSMALKSDGTLWATGQNTNGQLGDGTGLNKNIPTQIGIDNTWVSISGGNSHSFGLKSDGTLWGWGGNGNGQLGNGTTTSTFAPIQIGSDNKWVFIAAGSYHSLGSKSDGTLFSWGANNVAQLGDGSTTQSLNPILIDTISSEWISVSTGLSADFSLGLRSDGNLWGWGENDFGQLGDGTTINRNIPGKIGTDNTWVSFAIGERHCVAIKSNGTLWAWGANASGQLGDGTYTNRLTPVQIGTDNKWVSVSSGGTSTYGLKSDGTLWAWGTNGNGQLGDGTIVGKNSPVQVGLDNKWVSVSSGYVHCLGLKSDGTFWAWGYNFNGQLSDGTTVDKTSPTQILGTDNTWVSISAGKGESRGLKSNGTIWMCGYNGFGQLGDGTFIAKSNLIQIGTDTKWIILSSGREHCYGLKSTGTLWGWGNNLSGQLGDGTTTLRTSPVQIGSSINWISVSGGFSHSVGIKSIRSEYCSTGNNTYGQLGNFTNTNQSSFTCYSCIPPSAPSVGASVSICAGTTATISASGSGTISWYNSASGGTYLGGGINYTTAILTGTTTFYAQDSTCAPGAQTTVVVTVYSLPTVTATAFTDTVCEGTATILNGGGASSYVWSGGVTDGVGFIPSATSGYTVTGTDANTCSNSATVTVTVNTLPTVTATAIADTVCDGTPTVLNGGGASSYTWSGGVTDGISFVPSATSTYTVMGIDVNMCSNSATITITVDPLPLITTNLNGVVITANQNGAGYQWIDCNTNLPISGETGQSYTVTSNGDYAVIVTLGNCFDTSACVNVMFVGIVDNHILEVKIYPNLTTGAFTVQTNSIADAIIITDLLGRIITEITPMALNTLLTLENYNDGVYFVKVYSESKTNVVRLFKTN